MKKKLSENKSTDPATEAVIENISVTSLTGRVIYNQQPNSSETAINTSKWADGVYTIGITVDGKRSTVKVVVQH